MTTHAEPKTPLASSGETQRKEEIGLNTSMVKESDAGTDDQVRSKHSLSASLMTPL